MTKKILDIMSSNGLNPKTIIIDGKIHRFSTNNKSNDGAGFYCFTQLTNCIVGFFGDWRNNIYETYCSKSEGSMSNIERAQVQQEIKAQQLKKQREEKKLREQAALKAAEIMDNVDFNAEHEYIKRKQILMLGGAGVYSDELCVPCYNKNMQLVNVERITLDYKKPLYGGERSGVFSIIGTPAEGETILVAEGYATACSLHMATKKPVLISFNAGNLPNVASHFKSHPLIICADNDANEIGLKKANEAAKKHGNARIVLCPVSSDFNDMHVQQGLDAVRNFIYPQTPKIINGNQPSQYEPENWYDEWIYINNDDKYYSLKTKQKYSTQAFNLQCGQYLDLDIKQTAAAYVAKRGLIRIVQKAIYAPNISEKIFKMGNVDCINTFDFDSLPVPATNFTSAGEKAINNVLFHIHAIANNNDEHYNILLNWIAWQVQHKGEKILWCPVIQGAEGIGKSFFGELLAQMLGYENINTVAPNEILSQFNGWAAGACVSVLSEIRIVGQDRYGAANALKPLITDQHIQINIKNVPAYNVINVTNYICMTNFKDAIPISSNDRRWWILYSEYEDIADFLTKNQANDDYFINLFDDLRTHSAEIHKYFLDWKISDGFKKLKQAPKTEYKQQLLANENSKIHGYVEAMDLLVKGGAYYNEDAICSADFFDALKSNYDELDFRNQNRALLLQKLGYTFYKVMRINDKPRKIYIKNNKLSDKEIKNMFEIADYY